MVIFQWHPDSEGVKVLIHEPFRPYGWGGPFVPDLKRNVCQYSHTVQTTQNIGFNLSVPNTAYYIPKRGNRIRQPVSNLNIGLKWRKDRRSQRMVTRVARLNTSTFPLLYPVSSGCTVCLRERVGRTVPTAWGSTGLNQPYDRYPGFCVSPQTCFRMLAVICFGLFLVRGIKNEIARSSCSSS